MQTSLQKMNVVKAPDVKRIMNCWSKQKHYPIIEATRDYFKEWVDVSMSNFNESEESWIPLTFTTNS